MQVTSLFCLGAYLFEDVEVTAYKGASPLIQNKTCLEVAAGIIAAEACHAELVGTGLYSKGVGMSSLRDATVAISNACDSLDSMDDIDQGIIGVDADISTMMPQTWWLRLCTLLHGYDSMGMRVLYTTLCE